MQIFLHRYQNSKFLWLKRADEKFQLRLDSYPHAYWSELLLPINILPIVYNHLYMPNLSNVIKHLMKLRISNLGNEG